MNKQVDFRTTTNKALGHWLSDNLSSRRLTSTNPCCCSVLDFSLLLPLSLLFPRIRWRVCVCVCVCVRARVCVCAYHRVVCVQRKPNSASHPALNVLYVSEHACTLGSNCSSKAFWGVCVLACVCVWVAVFCCLAGTSHRVAGSCLAFWVKRSRAGGVREGHSGNRSLSSPTAGRDASLTLALFFSSRPPFSFLPTPVNHYFCG